jgi:hypothetical protein
MIFADKIYSEENRNCAERGRCIFKWCCSDKNLCKGHFKVR